MLSLLKIRNFALIDELSWQLHAGFLGITGETGAGKSVIMAAIALVLGGRADKGMIRSGESQCSIEAVFELSRISALNLLLEEAGLPLCEDGQLIIRRQMTASGNKQYVNQSAVTLQFLRQIAVGLVDMHHPDSHRSLGSQDRQLEMLDTFAQNEALRLRYRALFAAWRAADSQWRELRDAEMANARELDFLRHQLAEIDDAAFTLEEVDSMEAQWQRARNAGRLHDVALPMWRVLDAEDGEDGEEGMGSQASVLALLRGLVRSSHELSRLDASCESWLAPLADSVTELENLASRLESYLDESDFDGESMGQLEARVAQFDLLKRKYGVDFAEIDAHAEACRAKLEAIDNREQLLEQLDAAAQAAAAELLQLSLLLRASRVQAASVLESDFLLHAQHLGFLQAHFKVELFETSNLLATGGDEVDFLFGPNLGEPLKPLRMIASSGELARVMLALKSALAKQDDTPLLIFDEIDANVGGKIASAVGLKMRELGEDHQVIAITHFPQVAALANYHYLISKVVEQGRSLSRLSELSGECRTVELMRMLGADGETARAHARDLLGLDEEKKTLTLDTQGDLLL